MKKLVVSLFCCLGLVACTERRISRQLKEFMGQTVIIPTDMIKFFNGEQIMDWQIPEIPLMVFYHDSLSCSSCQISHLSDIERVYELADSLGTFDVMTIFSPKAEELGDVLKKIAIRDFEYPVYVDISGSFSSARGHIPSDKRFHSFLLNQDKCPVFVGNPVNTDKLWELFMLALEKIE